MVDTVVDFISLIKDIRGNQFDSAGLPLNGKWKDIKDWDTSVSAVADQVVLDASQVASDKDATAASLLSALSIEANASVSALASAASASESDTSAIAAAASETQTAADVLTAAATIASLSTDIAAVTAAKVAAEVSATTSGSYSATAQASATAAGLSESASSISAANALQSADNADISEGNALSYRDATETLSVATESNATAAANSAATASASELGAVDARDDANAWAVTAEDVLVNDGVNTAAYSAYHWAQKAVNIVGGVTGFTDLSDVPGGYAGASGYTLRINSAENAIEFVLGTAVEVGLGNVDNTSDADKPLSSAAVTALGLKAPITVTDSIDIRLTDVETDTTSISNELAAGNDPARVQISKAVYSTTSQTLGAVEPPALTRHDLVASMIAAETIGAY